MSCDRCDFVSIPERVGRHRYNHAHFDQGDIECAPCSFTFLYDIELKRHRRLCHEVPAVPVRKYTPSLIPSLG